MASPDTPVLSVVIPVHGVEAHLRECLGSILDEPVAGVQVVAVDDCSPDSCGAILDEYARCDPRVRVLHLGANVGLGRARNAGIDQAVGEYIWFVDGDDRLTPGAIRAVVDRLVDTRPDVLVVDHVEVFDDGRTVAGTPSGALAGDVEPGPLADRPHLLRLAHSACTKVVRRQLLDDIALRFHPGWYEDCAYTHHLLLAAERIDTLDRVCYVYRRRGSAGAITRTRSPRHFDVFDQYQRLFAVVEAAPAYEPFRGDLFRVMVDHCLVIAGNDLRLPPNLRRSFFRRMAADYRRWRPAGGYPAPGGVAGLKHRLVNHDAYLAYAALRLVYRAAGRLRGLVRRCVAAPGVDTVPVADVIDRPAGAPAAVVPAQRNRVTWPVNPDGSGPQPGTLPDATETYRR